ncbi:MAG: WXG100 family type VII secretion target [Anaerolineales bacterium]|nr:WXG100 family type VII secretion target [Anaerolineales bacterium]
MINRVRVEEVPPEAFQIAAQFDQQANVVRQQVQQLQKIKAHLSANWRGNSGSQFQQEVDIRIKELIRYADWLSTKANEIRNKRVSQWKLG